MGDLGGVCAVVISACGRPLQYPLQKPVGDGDRLVTARPAAPMCAGHCHGQAAAAGPSSIASSREWHCHADALAMEVLARIWV